MAVACTHAQSGHRRSVRATLSELTALVADWDADQVEMETGSGDDEDEGLHESTSITAISQRILQMADFA